MNYYEGYLLDDLTCYDLTDDDKLLLEASIWLVEHKSTIVSTAENFNYSKSTLHRLIHTRLNHLSDELYRCVCRILDSHKR